MWAELAAQRDRFIGGELQDCDPDGEPAPVTRVVDVTFEDDMFAVHGESYACFIDSTAAIGGDTDGWFHVRGPYCHWKFRGKLDLEVGEKRHA